MINDNQTCRLNRYPSRFALLFCYLERHSRKDFEYSDENDDEETMKQFLPNSSTGNGDIRLTSSSNKSHRHRSRRATPIVLIPQQSHSSTTLAQSTSNNLPHSRCQYHLFNSNMYLLERHLKHLIDKQKHEEDRNEVISEWKLMALIMDRLLFWLFAFFTFLSTILCLIIIPLLKNSGYIPALAKDLRTDYRSTETIASVIENHLGINLTGVSTVEA